MQNRINCSLFWLMKTDKKNKQNNNRPHEKWHERKKRKRVIVILFLLLIIVVPSRVIDKKKYSRSLLRIHPMASGTDSTHGISREFVSVCVTLLVFASYQGYRPIESHCCCKGISVCIPSTISLTQREPQFMLFLFHCSDHVLWGKWPWLLIDIWPVERTSIIFNEQCVLYNSGLTSIPL